MLRVYTDGSTSNNGQAGAQGGVGVYFGPGDSRNVSEPFPDDDPTNQKCELLAIVRALEVLSATQPTRPAVVVTDSKYAIGCLTQWCKKWRTNGFKTSGGDPVKNEALIRRGLALLDTARVTLDYTKGHSTSSDPDSVGNREADRLANEGRARGAATAREGAEKQQAHATESPPPPKKKRKTAAAPKTAPLDLEQAHWSDSTFVIGVDEVGRGCLAGDLTVCAIALPLHSEGMEGVRDSKRLTAKSRERLAKAIRERAVAMHVASKSPAEIDDRGILHATLDAMREAVQSCHYQLLQMGHNDVHVLVDGNVSIPDLGLPQQTLDKGDAKSQTIAAASIVAKVDRDARMCALTEEPYGKYKFDKHKGYGTKAHYDALHAYGPCDLHRTSFRLSGGWKR